MRKFLSFLLAFALTTPTYAQSPIIWGPSNTAQMLNSGPLVTKDGQTISANGVLNLARNTDAAVNLVGIADSGTGTDLSRTVTTSEIPLYPQRQTAIKIAPESSGSGFTRISCFTLPSNGTLDNTKLGVSFYQMVGAGYTSGNLTVDVYSQASSDCSDAGTRLSLSTDSSSVSAIPALSGYFATMFDTTTADYYSIRITRAAGTAGATNWLAINGIYVGPGLLAQGAVVGEWISFTPTYSGTLSTSSNVGKYRRVGDSMEIEASLTASGTGVGSNFALTIPASLNINTNAISRASSSYVSLGSGVWFDSSLNDVLILGTTYLSATTLYFWYNTATFDTLDNADIETGDEIGFRATVPILEWAGSGTLNVLQSDTLSEWTTFTPTYTNGPTTSANTGRWRRIGDSMEVEISFTASAAGAANNLALTIPNSLNIDTTKISSGSGANSHTMGVGVFVDTGSSTVATSVSYNAATNVAFLKLTPSATQDFIDGDEFGNTDQFSAHFMVPILEWRGRVGGGPVGFAQARQDALGLVKAGQVPGTNTNDSACTGCVGEVISDSDTGVSLSSTTPKTVTGPLNLTAGVWLVSGSLVVTATNALTAYTYFDGGVDNTADVLPSAASVPSATGEVYYAQRYSALTPGNGSTIDMAIPSYIVTIAAGNTLTLRGNIQSSFTNTSNGGGWLQAVRIR